MTYFWALSMGLLMPVQALLNTKLSGYLGHPIWGSFISFLGGVIVLGIALLTFKINIPSFEEAPPWFLYCGGIIGAFFVTSIIFVGPKIGFTSMTFLVVIGQFTMSMLIDYKLGLISNISIQKIASIAIVSFGSWLFLNSD